MELTELFILGVVATVVVLIIYSKLQQRGSSGYDTGGDFSHYSRDLDYSHGPLVSKSSCDSNIDKIIAEMKPKIEEESKNILEEIFDKDPWLTNGALEDLSEEYKGKVKRITRFYTNIEGDVVKKGGVRFVANYAENQKIADCTIYDQDGGIIDHSVYQYDSNDNLLRVKDTSKPEAEQLTVQNQYDIKNNLTVSKWYENGKEWRSLYYTYDVNGNCVEEKEVIAWDHETDPTVSRSVYVYDKDNVLKECITNADNAKTKEVYVSTGDENCKEEQTVDIASGKVLRTTRYVCKKNATGLQKEDLTYTDDELESKYVYSYDSDGNLVASFIYDGSENLDSRYEFERDDRGNLCGQKEYKKGSLSFAFVDEIEYYD